MAFANPFEEKIFNGLLTQNDLQPQVFTGLNEFKESHGRIFIQPFF